MMYVPVFSGGNTNPGHGQYQFIQFNGIGWSSTEADRQNLMPACTLIEAFWSVLVAPGSGNSRLLTLRKNGASQSADVTIADSNTTGFWAGEVEFAAGDLGGWLHQTVGSPTSASRTHCGMRFRMPSGKTCFMLAGTSGNLSTSATQYIALQADTGADLATAEGPVAMNADLKSITVSLQVAPGVGNSRIFTVLKNGTPTGGTLTISGTNTTGTWTGTVSSSEGDYVALEASVTGTPAASRARCCTVWEPEENGYSLHLMTPGSDDAGNSHAHVVGGSGVTGWNATENQRQALAVACTISRWYGRRGAAAGAGNVRRYRFRKNEATLNGAGDLLLEFDGASQTVASDLTRSVTYANGDRINCQAFSTTGSPANALFSGGFVAYIEPPTSGAAAYLLSLEDEMIDLRQSTAVTLRVGPFLNKTTLDPITDLESQTGRIHKHGASVAALTPASWAHDANGYYMVGLSDTHSNTRGPLMISFSGAYLPVRQRAAVLSQDAFDEKYSAGSIEASVWGAAEKLVTVQEIEPGAIQDESFASGAITADAIADNAVTAAKFATGALAAVWDNEERTLSDFDFAVQLQEGQAVDVVSVGGTAVAGPDALKADVSDIAATVAKLEAMIESSGGGDRFSVHALSQAPGGEGSSPEEIWAFNDYGQKLEEISSAAELQGTADQSGTTATTVQLPTGFVAAADYYTGWLVTRRRADERLELAFIVGNTAGGLATVVGAGGGGGWHTVPADTDEVTLYPAGEFIVKLEGIRAKTNALPNDPASIAAITAATGAITGAVAAIDVPTPAEIREEIDTGSEKLEEIRKNLEAEVQGEWELNETSRILTKKDLDGNEVANLQLDSITKPLTRTPLP
jgi:hypothetical protein